MKKCCTVCYSLFSAGSANAKYCSALCSNTGINRRRNERNKERTPRVRECVVCLALIATGTGSRKVCSEDCRKTLRNERTRSRLRRDEVFRKSEQKRGKDKRRKHPSPKRERTPELRLRGRDRMRCYRSNPAYRAREREREAQWKVKNGEILKQRGRDRYWSDPDKFKEYASNYRVNNRNKVLEALRSWRKKNKVKIAEQGDLDKAAYRAAVKEGLVEKATTVGPNGVTGYNNQRRVVIESMKVLGLQKELEK